MDKKQVLVGIVGLMLMIPATALAQNEFGAKEKERYNEFRLKAYREYEAFRLKCNKDYADFMRKAWRNMNAEAPIELPKEKDVAPVEVTPQDLEKPATDKCIFSVVLDWVYKVKDKIVSKGKNKNRGKTNEPNAEQTSDNDKNRVKSQVGSAEAKSSSGNSDDIGRVILAPEPQKQPVPIKEVKEIPSNILPMSKFDFKYFGTDGSIRLDRKDIISIGNLSNDNLADAWMKMSDIGYVNLIHDCLELRQTHNLCDWAYLLMLKDMAESVYGKDTNEATLLMAYVFCQSGYKMRLAYGGNRLYMLYASNHVIFDNIYFNLDGEKFYPFDKKDNTRLAVCPMKFPEEKSMSLLVKDEPKLNESYTDVSQHNTSPSLAHPVRVSVTSNQNMLDFYTSYPTSMVGSNVLTRWAMYANMPMPEHIKKEVYPQLNQAIGGLGQVEAASTLLTWLHRGFVYEYDDVVWGEDRAFFPEETLHYPYCDCEDRAILYTRLVRDLLGLDCILVYYPGHLACAVNFTEPVPGDYIMLDDRRYTITDPTYLGARIGQTMPGMDNAQAQVILLKDYSQLSGL